jgi:hypothetical protein
MDTEAEARAECSKLVQNGYVIEVTGPNVHLDQADRARHWVININFVFGEETQLGAAAANLENMKGAGRPSKEIPPNGGIKESITR